MSGVTAGPEVKNVILSFSLPDSGDALADLKLFRKVWCSVAEKNPSLLAQTHLLLLLSVREQEEEDVTAEATRQKVAATMASLTRELRPSAPRAHLIRAKDHGKRFNQALSWALAAESMTYWVHWDDEHICCRPFWNSARAVLEGAGRDLWQLQLTDDWTGLPSARRLLHEGFTVVVPHPDEARKRSLDLDAYVDAEPYLSHWPVFSLRSNVQRLAPLREAVFSGKLDARPFREGAESWTALQWRFGLLFEAVGGINGMLEPHAAVPAREDEEENEKDNEKEEEHGSSQSDDDSNESIGGAAAVELDEIAGDAIKIAEGDGFDAAMKHLREHAPRFYLTSYVSIAAALRAAVKPAFRRRTLPDMDHASRNPMSPWQQALWDVLQTAPTPRRLFWVRGECGAGKSWMINYIEKFYSYGCLAAGQCTSLDDVVYTYEGEGVVLWELPKRFDYDRLGEALFGVVERFSDFGQVLTSMKHQGKRIATAAHVVVFAGIACPDALLLHRDVVAMRASKTRMTEDDATESPSTKKSRIASSASNSATASLIDLDDDDDGA